VEEEDKLYTYNYNFYFAIVWVIWKKNSSIIIIIIIIVFNAKKSNLINMCIDGNN